MKVFRNIIWYALLTVVVSGCGNEGDSPQLLDELDEDNLSENLPIIEDFENNNFLENWASSNPNYVNVDASISYSGSSSVHILSDSEGPTELEFNKQILVEKNKIIVIELMTKTNGISTQPAISAELVGNTSETYSLSKHATYEAQDGGWMRHFFYFHIIDPITPLNLFLTIGYQEAWIDDTKISVVVDDTTIANNDTFPGTWQSDCVLSSNGSSYDRLVVSDSLFTNEIVLFSDSLCMVPGGYVTPNTWTYTMIEDDVTSGGLPVRLFHFEGHSIVDVYFYISGNSLFFTENLTMFSQNKKQVEISRIYKRL
ncbi:hypothetical protein [Kaarinaea lacus]